MLYCQAQTKPTGAPPWLRVVSSLSELQHWLPMPLQEKLRRRRPALRDQDYRRAIVIDGLGGFDDPYGPQGTTIIDPRAVTDLEGLGLTMSHFTVNTVGNAPDVWDKTIVTIAQIDRVISDNPEVLIKVNTTADIRRAKREGKSAVLYGTAGHQPRGCRSRSACAA